MWMKVVFPTSHPSESVLVSSVDVHWMNSQNLSRIKMKSISSPCFLEKDLLLKALLVGTTIHARHPDRLCYSRQLQSLMRLQVPQAVSF